MTDGLERVLAKIRRRIALQIGRFLLTAVNDTGLDSGGRVSLQRVDGLILKGERELTERTRFQNYGLTSHPIPGSCEGAALAIGGSRSHLVIVALDDAEHRPTGLAEGEVALYTDEVVAVKLKRDSELELRGDDLDASFADSALVGAGTGDLVLGSVGGKVTIVTWGSGVIALLAVGQPVNITGTAINLTGAVNIIGNVALTGTLTINGKDVSDTHTHPAGTPPGDTGQVN